MLKGFESTIVMNIISCCYKTIIGKANINPHYQYEKKKINPKERTQVFVALLFLLSLSFAMKLKINRNMIRL